jgi:aspartate/methionine/tyrosine aminotransferase
VFEVMSRLARESGRRHLGQGFPDDPGPEDVRRKAAEAVIEGWNQYPPMMGLPELRAAVAAHYGRWQNLNLDPETDVMITSGATEALAGALLALIEPGDEVVLFEPMYDAYLPLVRRAGGVPRLVTLEPPRFGLTEAALVGAFSDRTKVVLFNNPLNPTATVFSPEDLALLAQFCVRHDAVAVCDEVWEHVVFDGRRHQPAAWPARHARAHGQDRLGGKIFNLTGWKVGFVCAAPPLMRVLAKAHQFLTFTTPAEPPGRRGYGLAKDDAISRACVRLARSPRPLTAGPARPRLRVIPRRNLLPQHRHRAWARADDEAFCRRSWRNKHGSRRRGSGARLLRLGGVRTWCASASHSGTRR